MPNLDLRQLNLKSLELDELTAINHKIEQEISHRQDAKKREALSQIQNLVKSHGLNFDEVTQSVRITAKRRKAPALYRNPANPRQTWSGKGEAPDWFRDAPNPEALRIQG